MIMNYLFKYSRVDELSLEASGFQKDCGQKRRWRARRACSTSGGAVSETPKLSEHSLCKYRLKG